MKKHIKLKVFILIIVLLFASFALIRSYINKTKDITYIISTNWKVELPKPIQKTEVLSDEIGGFTGDGTQLVKFTYDKPIFDKLIKKVDFIPADGKFYSKYDLFLKSVNKKSEINELVDVTNNNTNIKYKIVEAPSGFFIMLIDGSKSKDFTLYCLTCTK
ncbi:hypothetical protein [Clostridium manihotivorum]|uniref:Uncharacterized protein n=1 Tax=Clostridium manihotivorum TaxID=2320868 RepID=A0A3R5R0S4_9CLOT|nr:hypothetical protein [Clostridium manihotivorum]QAA34010.1 hypothetical protein C1I91_21610 [Clostridium manihotivorum]